jgi:hypothetical protein
MGGGRPASFGQVQQTALWDRSGTCAKRRMESRMSKSAQIVLVMAMAAVLAACAPKAPEPAPEITVEPTDTGKYK